MKTGLSIVGILFCVAGTVAAIVDDEWLLVKDDFKKYMRLDDKGTDDGWWQ